MQYRRMNSRLTRRIAPLIVGCGLLAALPAHAALGGGASSVAADAQSLGGAVNATPLQTYDIEEIDAASGMRVREFLDRAGVVFAVTWSGPVMPDLRQLLGSDYAAYARAVAALDRAGLSRSLKVVLPDAIVEVGGHLRAYSGRAFRPAALPAGITVADLH